MTISKYLSVCCFCLLAHLSTTGLVYGQSTYCSDVKVLSAGSKSNYNSTTEPIIQVRLQNTRNDCGTWSDMWFVLDNSSKAANSMLATVLTAMSTGSSVTIIPKAGGTSYTINGTISSVFANAPSN